jgi:hypothetical protein
MMCKQVIDGHVNAWCCVLQEAAFHHCQVVVAAAAGHHVRVMLVQVPLSAPPSMQHSPTTLRLEKLL